MTDSSVLGEQGDPTGTEKTDFPDLLPLTKCEQLSASLKVFLNGLIYAKKVNPLGKIN